MKAIIQHLRLPFSILLMPIFWFALGNIQQEGLNINHAIILFIVLHVLVYPASNAYNSTQDKDEGSVGLIENPLPIPKRLFLITVILDLVAIILSLTINWQTSVLVFIYIIASRLYSWRRVRLKQYPVIGFLTVFICQGALVCLIVFYGCANYFSLLDANIYSLSIILFIASLFIGSVYPLSQIYQHEQDKNDGVLTISALLGYRNTFLFSGLQFVIASTLISYYFYSSENYFNLMVYTFFQLPVIVFFIWWFYQVMKNHAQANYQNTMRMNLISAFCMNLCFIMLLYNGL